MFGSQILPCGPIKRRAGLRGESEYSGHTEAGAIGALLKFLVLLQWEKYLVLTPSNSICLKAFSKVSLGSPKPITERN